MKGVGDYDSNYLDGMMNYYAVVSFIKEMNKMLIDEATAIDAFSKTHPEWRKNNDR